MWCRDFFCGNGLTRDVIEEHFIACKKSRDIADVSFNGKWNRIEE